MPVLNIKRLKVKWQGEETCISVLQSLLTLGGQLSMAGLESIGGCSGLSRCWSVSESCFQAKAVAMRDSEAVPDPSCHEEAPQKLSEIKMSE